MTDDTSDQQTIAADVDTADGADSKASQSARWRSVWRLHFYAGMFSMPFILLMAVTGLVILYTQPLQNLTQGDLRDVDPGGQTVPFEQQVAAVQTAYPDAVIVSLTPPSKPDKSTIVGFESEAMHGAGNEAFVDPYTGRVLGAANADGGVIGLSNRLHGFLNVESVTVPLPAVAALWDDGPVMRDYVVFDLVLEILGVWTIVLMASGMFLWWPRRKAASAAVSAGSKGSILGVRRGVRGRPRWRDLHGLSGVLLLGAMLLTLISGFAWSTYWGQNVASLAEKLTPSSFVEPPPSGLGTRGDLDRLGNKINWNTGDTPLPASYAGPTDGSVAQPMSLDDIVAIAREEGMKQGFTVYFPANYVDEEGVTTYGAFTVSNSWPRATGEARDLFLDQFTGETLAEQTGWGYGSISYGLDVLVSTHMGTQLGLFSRILMTALCVLSIWSVISALVMYTKRRRPGTAGLPRRPVDVRLARSMVVVAVVLGIVFPQWGVTALAVLAFDRYVIRRVPRLRVAFGQR